MNLINMKPLPDFPTIQYANNESKQVWGEKIEKAEKFYSEMELLSVKYGLRKCMIIHGYKPYDLDRLGQYLINMGLLFYPIRKEGTEMGFHVTHNPKGNRYGYRIVVCREPEHGAQFIQATLDDNHQKIGELLGYPKKAVDFFEETWNQKIYDPIWQQALNTNEKYIKNNTILKRGVVEEKLIRLSLPEEANVSLNVFRYIGVRVLSNFTSSFYEEESIELANKWIELGRDLKLEGLDETLDILKLPFSWDCLKGVALINTPVFKVTTPSMPCFPRHVIQKESDFYPKEAPFGLSFPWKTKMMCGG